MGLRIDNELDAIEELENEKNDRDQKYYKDIYGNDVRLLTNKEKKYINYFLMFGGLFIVVLVSAILIKAYLLQKETEERTKLYMLSGESVSDGQSIINAGGTILSNDISIVKILDDGTLVAKNSGKTNITIFKNLENNVSQNKKKKKNVAKIDENYSLMDAYNDLGIDSEITIEVNVENDIKDLKISTKKMELLTGETDKLNALIFPTDAINSNIRWLSDNTNVVTVDSEGRVAARGAGTAIVSVTTVDGTFKDDCIVVVNDVKNKNSLYLEAKEKVLDVKDETTIKAIVAPNYNLVKNIIYTSSDPSIAEVNSNGVIKAHKPGKVSITGSLVKEKISNSINITVRDNTLKDFYVASKYTMKVNNNLVIAPVLFPSSALAKFSYKSSDESVAKVDNKGTVTALKAGKTTISVKINDKEKKILVEVLDSGVIANGLSLSASTSTIELGQSVQIKPSVLPSNATDKTVYFVSSNEKIATVDTKGKVTGIKAGKVTITATNSFGKTSSVNIKVTDKVVKATDLKIKTTKLETGKIAKISYELTPKYATGSITWKVQDSSIAKVDGDIIIGIKPGVTKLTGEIDGVVKSANIVVDDIKLTSISFDKKDLNLYLGQMDELKINYFPYHATKDGVIWTSSDPSVARVENGKVKAVSSGNAVITATDVNDSRVKTSCNVTVTKVFVDSFVMNKHQYFTKVGSEVKTVIEHIRPKNATDTKAFYKIENGEIATVNSNGVIRGISEGSTTLYVTVGDKVQEYDVYVYGSGDRIHFINTQKSTDRASDAILLESNGKFGLMDSGSNVSSLDVIHYLNDLGVKRLDFVLITHFQSEAFGGVYGNIKEDNLLLNEISVNKLIIKSYSGADSVFYRDNKQLTKMNDIQMRRDIKTDIYNRIRSNASVNKTSIVKSSSISGSIKLGNMKINLFNTNDVLNNYKGECLKNYNCDENSNSIVSIVSVNGKNIYLSGDIYDAYHDSNSKYLKEKTEEKYAKSISSKYTIDVYKASNNGNSNSNTKAAMSYIKPKYTVITNKSDQFTEKDKGLINIKNYTQEKIYYSGDNSVILNINSNGNMSFLQK